MSIKLKSSDGQEYETTQEACALSRLLKIKFKMEKRNRSRRSQRRNTKTSSDYLNYIKIMKFQKFRSTSNQ